MDDPFQSTPVSGVGLRKSRSRPDLMHQLPAPPSSNSISAQLERTPSPELLTPDLNASSLRTHLQELLEHKSGQLEMVGTMGQKILSQQAELEERIQSLGDMDSDADEIDDDTRGKLLELQEAMKGWEDDNQGIMRELQVPKVSGGQYVIERGGVLTHRTVLGYLSCYPRKAGCRRRRTQHPYPPTAQHGAAQSTRHGICDGDRAEPFGRSSPAASLAKRTGPCSFPILRGERWLGSGTPRPRRCC